MSKKQKSSRLIWRKAFFYLMVHRKPDPNTSHYVGPENSFIIDIKNEAWDINDRHFSNMTEVSYAKGIDPTFSLEGLREEITSWMKALVFDGDNPEPQIALINERISLKINNRYKMIPRRIELIHSKTSDDIFWVDEKIEKTIIDECYESFRNFLFNSGDVWKSMRLCEWCSLPYIPRTKIQRFCITAHKDKFHRNNDKK